MQFVTHYVAPPLVCRCRNGGNGGRGWGHWREGLGHWREGLGHWREGLGHWREGLGQGLGHWREGLGHWVGMEGGAGVRGWGEGVGCRNGGRGWGIGGVVKRGCFCHGLGVQNLLGLWELGLQDGYYHGKSKHCNPSNGGRGVGALGVGM